ncbi:hypothetical protein ABFS82_08G244200 [Erythranthe guttata]
MLLLPIINKCIGRSPMSQAQPKPLLAIQTTTSPTSESDHQEYHHGGGGGGGGGGDNININGNINNILQLSPPLGLPPSSLQKKSVKYMECLKNHAAAIGGTATDGCGEFMAGGEEGSLEALKCSACNCHRNFHRKIQLAEHHHQLMFMKKRSTSGSGVYINGAGEAAEIGLAIGGGGHNQTSLSSGELGKKRYRTKFSQEQKEKMQVFAERASWKITKLDESEVRSFCQEIGIKRKVLKVWMHNNKYHLTKKTTTTTATTTSVE